MCLVSISSFTRSCRDIIQGRWKVFRPTSFWSRFIRETVYQILSELSEFCQRYYKNIVVFWSFRTHCTCNPQSY